MEHLAMEEVRRPSSKVSTTLIKVKLKSYKVKHEFKSVCPIDGFQFVVDCPFLSYKRASTSKAQSPGSRAASLKQNDLWFESNTTLNGGEDQAGTRDSYFKDGTSTGQHNSSLSRRGTGESTLKPFSMDNLLIRF